MANEVKKIIFFNRPSEVDDYLANDARCLEINRSDCLFIAMNPVVRAYLGEKSIPAQDTSLYFTTDSHGKTLEKSNIMLEWLRKESNFLDLGMGIKRAYKDSFIFLTRCLIHYCLWTIETITNVIAVHNPQIICASYSGKKPVSSFFIEPEEEYFGYIVKVIAKTKNLKYENIPLGITRNSSILSGRSNYLQALAKFIIKSQKFNFLEKRISKNNSFDGTPIIFTTNSFQMDKLIVRTQNMLKDKSFYILNRPVVASFNVPNFVIRLLWNRYSDAIVRQKRVFKDLLKSIRTETEVFTYKDISFADIISQKLEDNIANFILGLYLWTIRLDKFIDKVKPAAIVSNGDRYDDVILAELCNKKNIPAVLISHGSHIHPKNKYEQIEWRENNKALLDAPFSYLALQSPLAEAYLKSFPAEGEAIKTGPLIWGTTVNLERSRLLFKKMFNTKYKFKDIKVIVHAGTPKQTKALRLYVYETPDEYIRSLCDLANAIEAIPHVILIIKFRSSPEIRVESLKKLVPFSERVILSIDESFIDVLGLADLLVSFSSTAIEESLQNRIPVLLYGGGGRYQHIPAHEITSDNSIQPSAIYHVKEAGYLENAIRKIFNLDIDAKRSENLFEPYIYAQDVRTSLADLLKSSSEKGGRIKP